VSEERAKTVTTICELLRRPIPQVVLKGDVMVVQRYKAALEEAFKAIGRSRATHMSLQDVLSKLESFYQES